MMENKILGLHHITAIAGNAQRNFNFYTKILGLRLVKKTVNFDDPGTYHFYFGDESGTPGTILTFFPWANVKPGKNGAGMATDIGYSVPAGSLDFWKIRFVQNNVAHDEVEERFGEQLLSFRDPDGLHLHLVVSKKTDNRQSWQTPEINNDVAIKGFHSVTLTLKDIKATAAVLISILGYKPAGQENNRHRFTTDAIGSANTIDLLLSPDENPGINAAGTNHHIAFRVKDENVLMQYREKVVKAGLRITEKIDRNYFFSLYFREPGGVLFEIATDNPGFSIDEPVNELGEHLKLPEQYEAHRRQIEKVLPVIDQG
jgi:glyoxalase family protein